MRFLVRSRWSILLTFRNLIDRAPSDNRAGRCEGCSSRRRVPSFFHQRINAGSARLIVITSSAQCSPTETAESDISIWANGDFSIWRLQSPVRTGRIMGYGPGYGYGYGPGYGYGYGPGYGYYGYDYAPAYYYGAGPYAYSGGPYYRRHRYWRHYW